MITKRSITKRKVVSAALALACAPMAHAVNIDFSGSNIYMKFLDGNKRSISYASGDTATGSDQGQWTEFELRMKATISPQVEAGVRVQSRSSAAYWSNFGFNNNEGFLDCDTSSGKTCSTFPNTARYMKLRGAYVQLTPNYGWLQQARIGDNDWGMFDPFTVGKSRYIDRDNLNGFYFRGALPAKGASWELARITVPNYLQFGWGTDNISSSPDTTNAVGANEAVYIGQIKIPVADWKVTSSFQSFSDRVAGSGGNAYQTVAVDTKAKNEVFMIKAEGSPMAGIDVGASFYQSSFKVNGDGFNKWSNSPRKSVNDNAYKLDLAFNNLGVDNLGLNVQLFNIGKAYYSNMASRRESDALLTEGSEAAWFNWGQKLWYGGSYGGMTQTPALRWIATNEYSDFDETASESALGWKGITAVANYDIADTPMKFEISQIGYNSNTQIGAGGDTSNPASASDWDGYYFTKQGYQDRKTTIMAFKANHVVPVAGGVNLGFKAKWVNDKDNADKRISSDDVSVKDSTFELSAANQLHKDLWGKLQYGYYKRNKTVGGADQGAKKGIWSLQFSYNLTGFESGLVMQRVDGDGYLDGAKRDFNQYRMKGFVKVIF